jgi:hypothetical protein
MGRRRTITEWEWGSAPPTLLLPASAGTDTTAPPLAKRTLAFPEQRRPQALAGRGEISQGSLNVLTVGCARHCFMSVPVFGSISLARRYSRLHFYTYTAMYYNVLQ